MKYKSTRGGEPVSLFEAVLQGFPSDGGVYVPVGITLHPIKAEEIEGQSYSHLGASVLQDWIEGNKLEELEDMMYRAYGHGTDLGSFHSIDTKLSIVETFHGPSLSFYDMGNKLFHILLEESSASLQEKDGLVLTAMKGAAGVSLWETKKEKTQETAVAFYSEREVEPLQAMQMQVRRNTHSSVWAVRGTTAEIEEKIRNRCKNEGSMLTIGQGNIGQVLGEILYWVFVYGRLFERGCVEEGETIDVLIGHSQAIPSLLWAKELGLPLGRIYMTTTVKGALSTFLETGRYDEREGVVEEGEKILLERLLYILAKGKNEVLASWLESLDKTGQVELEEEYRTALATEVVFSLIPEDEEQAIISQVYNSFGYLLDPHGAAGFSAYIHHQDKREEVPHFLLVSSHHPFLYPRIIGAALELEEKENIFSLLEDIGACTGMALPSVLQELKEKGIGAFQTISLDEMELVIDEEIKSKK